MFAGAAALLMVLVALGSAAAVLTGDAARDDAVIPNAAAAALVARHENIGEMVFRYGIGAAPVQRRPMSVSALERPRSGGAPAGAWSLGPGSSGARHA